MQKQPNPQVGDIYLVRFHPSFGSELRKYRPAVIVAVPNKKMDNRFILIAPFSSNTKMGQKQAEVFIPKQPGVEKNSSLLCWYLWTIDKRRLQIKLGKLPQEKIVEMKKTVLSVVA